MDKFEARINSKDSKQLGQMIRSYKGQMKKLQSGYLYMLPDQELKFRKQYAMILALRDKRKSERTYADRSGLVGYWN